MPSEPTSNEPKPSSDSPSDSNVVAYTTDGRPIYVPTPFSPWALAYGTWAERARVG